MDLEQFTRTDNKIFHSEMKEKNCILKYIYIHIHSIVKMKLIS